MNKNELDAKFADLLDQLSGMRVRLKDAVNDAGAVYDELENLANEIVDGMEEEKEDA